MHSMSATADTGKGEEGGVGERLHVERSNASPMPAAAQTDSASHHIKRSGTSLVAGSIAGMVAKTVMGTLLAFT
jgi:hypothetical protein